MNIDKVVFEMLLHVHVYTQLFTCVIANFTPTSAITLYYIICLP